MSSTRVCSSSGVGWSPRKISWSVNCIAPGWLHASKLIARQHDEAEGGEGVFDAGVFLKPAYGVVGYVEHGVELCHLLGVGLAVECCQGSAIAHGCLLVVFACHEREQVGGDALCGY